MNNDLRETLENALSIQFMLEKELQHVHGNKSHLDKLVPESIKGVYTNKMRDALQLKQRILDDAYRAGIILLTATFERVAFAKYRTAAGDTVAYLDNAADLNTEYFVVRDRMVRPSLNRFSELMTLLEGKIETPLYEKLSLIRELRNQYAHGSTESVHTINEYPLQEVAETLGRILTLIETRGSA